MSLSIIEVKSSPQYQILSGDIEEAKRIVQETFCDLISYVSSASISDETVIELVLYKGDKGIRFFVILRFEEQQQMISNEQVIKTISMYLTNSNFHTQELFGEEYMQIIQKLRKQLSGKIIAITKGEKIAASSLSFSGYYYYTDILESTDIRQTEINNYNILMNQLMMCNNAMVSFQLIPTQMLQEEYYALANLANELSITTQGIIQNQRMLKETSAEGAKKTYLYYTERISQPLFIGNIIVASEYDNLNGIVTALKSGLQSTNQDPISLTSIEVVNDKQLSYDYFHFPWSIYSKLLYDYRNLNIWNGSILQPSNLFRLPFLYTASEASSFFKVPIDDGRIKGLRSNKIENDNESIGESAFSADNIMLGKLLNSDNKVFGTNDSDFTRHALIVGTPGSGKTTFSLNLLLQFYEKNIPFFAIEPTKTEYRALIDLIPDLQVFTPGNSCVVPFIINPFIPPIGITVEQYIPSLMSAFKAAFSMESPLDVIFLRSIRKCYAQYGWKNYSKSGDLDVQPFGMFEFVLVFKKIIETSSYSPETKANIETGGTFRLLNLIDQNKRIYDTIHSIPIDLLLKHPTVLELNAIGDDEQKALIIALLLIAICLYTKNRGSSSGKIKNILLIDEAHVLLDTPAKHQSDHAKAQSSAVKSLQKMIAEIRSFGTGIIIADQAPSKVTEEIVANTDLKVAFRLVEYNERNIIVNSTNMTELQSQHLARLKKGQAFVYNSSLESPKVIETVDVRLEKHIRYFVPDKEITNRIHFWDNNKALLIPYFECSFCPQCRSCNECDYNVREKAEYYASYITSVLGEKIKEKEKFIMYLYRLHELVISYEAQENERSPLKLICNCTKIHFTRNVFLEQNFDFTRQDIGNLLSQVMIKEEEH